MWLTRQLNSAEGAKITSGRVSGGDELTVQGESEYRCPETLFPYGLESRAAQGGKAVMLDGYCAGISTVADSSIAEGEVRLYSSGGAEIWLKNNGDVIINGQVIKSK